MVVLRAAQRRGTRRARYDRPSPKARLVEGLALLELINGYSSGGQDRLAAIWTK
jgi:hypothetical protein